MKKILFFVSAIAGLFLAGSCQRDNLEPVASSNTVTYTIEVPTSIATKALGDDVSEVTELHYEVWRTVDENETAFSDVDNLLYHKTATLALEGTTNKATITLDLINDQNFTVLFWAQVPDSTPEDNNNGVYSVGDLTNVTVTPTTANKESYAAFSGVDFIKPGQVLTGRTIALKRAVAQLNIGTTPASLSATTTGFQDNITISTSSVDVTGLSNSFNVATQQAGEIATTKFAYAEAAVPTKVDPADATKTIPETFTVGTNDYVYVAMNYVGFVDAGGSTVTVDYSFVTSEGIISNSIKNVPVKANYRTNIIGNLVTAQSDYVVSLDDDWGGAGYYGPDFVQEPLYNADTKTWTITNSYELAWVAQQVNSGSKTFKDEIVQVSADIDLNNEPWTPIGPTVSKSFQGTFEGVALTKSEETYPTIKNLVIENGNCSGLFGVLCNGGNVKNINFKGVRITGERQLGVVAGCIYGTITNVTVEDAEITAIPAWIDAEYDNGDKVAGIAGFIGQSATLTNNTVKNATFRAYRDMGGITGCRQNDYPSTITGNKVENLKFIVTSFYTPYNNNTSAGAYDPICGGTRSNAGDQINDNYGSDISSHTVLVEASEGAAYDSTNKVYAVTSPAGLESALSGAGAQGAGDHTIQILGDLDMTGVEWEPIEVDGYNGADIVTVEGNNATIKGLEGALFAGGFAGGSGIVIKDLTIENATMVADNTQGYGAFVNCADSMDEITLINCHLKNSSIITPNDGADKSRIGGLVGWTAGYNNQNDGPVDSYITIQNCSVTGCTIKGAGSIGGICGHAGANAATFTKIENCTVTGNTFISTDDGGWRVGAIVGTANNGQCTITNVTASDNVLQQVGKTAAVWQSELYGRFVPSGTGTLTIDGVSISETTPTLVDGYTALYIADEEYFIYNLDGLKDLHEFFTERYSNPFGKVFNVVNDIDAEGYTWASIWIETGNNDMTGSVINGNGNTISNLTISGGAMFSGTPNGHNSDVPMIFKNLTIDNADVTEGAHFNSVFWGQSYGDVAFENVVVKNTIISGNCNVGAFVGATSLEGTATAKLSFKDCSVINTSLSATAASNPDPTGASGFVGRAFGMTSIKFEGTNVVDGATTISNNGLVGGKVYAYTTWADGGFVATGSCDTFDDFTGVEAVKVGTNVYANFSDAVAAANSGDTVTLISDVTLSDETTLPAGITLNGNGKQINGSIRAGGDLNFAGHTKVTAFSASSNNHITITEGACLEVNGTDRGTFGYGNTIDIIGNIEDAKTVDKTTIQPSFIIPAGISITGGNDFTLNIEDAYVQIGSTTSKNSVASGKFTLNIENSIAEFTNQFTLPEPTNGKAPEFIVNFKNSVLTTATKLCIAASNSNLTFDNTKVVLGSYLRNSGKINLKNGSELTGCTIQFGENGGNNGAISIDNSTFNISCGGNAGHAFDGQGNGSISLSNNAGASVEYYKDMTISVDETSTFTGVEVQ